MIIMKMWKWDDTHKHNNHNRGKSDNNDIAVLKMSYIFLTLEVNNNDDNSIHRKKWQ